MASSGFNRAEFDDIAPWVKQLFADKFGSSIDTDDTTTAGMWAGVLSSVSNQVSQVIQGALNQCFVLSADGKGLDDQGSEWGLYRKQATHSYTSLKIECYFDPDSPTIIPGDSRFSTPDGKEFATLDDLTISSQGKDNNGNPLVDESGTPLGVGNVQAISVNPGLDENVAANSIVNPAQAIDGFYSVTNPSPAGGGAPSESDSLFRERIFLYRTAGPKFTDNGITAELRNLPDVEDTKLVDNASHRPADKYGNPWKSIHLYVLGGDDDEIAKTYFNCLYPTTHTVGSVSKTVTSDDGIQHTVKFDHAKSVEIFIHLKLKVDLSQFNQDQGPNDIRSNIMDYFNNLKMGDKVLYSRLFGPSYSENGVKNVQVELGTNPNNLQFKDIPMNEFELGMTYPDAKHIKIDLESDSNV